MCYNFVMSAWRRKTVELFPNLERDLNNQFTPYTVFMHLRMRCRDAHKRGDEAELSKIYGFAEWCHRHKAKDLWNAAGVSFYEHLGDKEITRQNIPQYVKPDIFEDISGLLQWQMGNSKFAKLKSEYEKHHKIKQKSE